MQIESSESNEMAKKRERDVRQEVDIAIAEPRIVRMRTLPEMRVTTYLTPELMEKLERQTRGKGVNRSEIIRNALTKHFEGSNSEIKADDGKIVVRSTRQTIFQIAVVLNALEEALDYDPKRHHNQPPPALRIDNPNYLAELQSLVAELRRLNDNLEGSKQSPTKRTRAPKKEIAKSAIDLRKHLNTFLSKYAATVGTGAGVLTVGALATLLYQLGMPEEVFSQILKKIK